MTTARKVAWSIIGFGLVGAFVSSFVVSGGTRHLPWVATFSLIILGLLAWNRSRGFEVFDAGEDVFLAVMVIFVTMFIWARVGF